MKQFPRLLMRLILTVSVGALLLGGGLLLVAFSGHRRPPHPHGMVFRITVREVVSPFDRIVVEPAADSRSAIVVRTPLVVAFPATVTEYNYPTGRIAWSKRFARSTRVLPRGEGPSSPAPTPVFDFDGDGTPDSIRVGEGHEYGLVEVISGASGAVLFGDCDPLEYENPARAFPLGDLDGDGFSELALVHPRRDRSEYDLDEPGDWLFGARSWITVISGADTPR